jgi:hypothetical protein
MSLIGDVADYENWLRKRCDVVEHGLCKKHDRMASDAFKFFRATSFRFARKLDKWLPQLGCAPQAPSVGDAHIENWGTWRDGEGRLVWGVNDFDDAAVLPYTYDLLRLATSAVLAPGLPGSNGERAAAITSGYRQGLNAPGPRFIDDEVPWMQALVNRPAAKAGAFAADLADIKRKEPPDKVAKALRKQLPKGTDNIEFCVWQRGGGSLGRPRYLAIGEWRGGLAVREAKALVPSAWSWAFGADDAPILFESLATGKYRSPDPFMQVRSNFIIRRIAPDSNKIDLAAEDAKEYGPKLLSAMGVDLASIHLAEGLDADLIVRDLNGRGPGWLLNAAQIASEAVCKDFEKWRSYHRTKSNM